MFDYPLTVHTDDNPGVALTCDAIPEFNAAGDTLAEAMVEAVDAMETALSIYVDQRRAIPEAPEAKPGQVPLRLPSVTQAKILLWNEVCSRGMRKADLCRLIGIKQAQGDRLVDFLHASKIDQVEDALRFLAIYGPAPYQRARFFYVPHKDGMDFVKLRAWSHHDHRITTEEANEIVLDTLATEDTSDELRAALVQMIKDQFKHWSYPEITYKGKKAGGGILFNYLDMPAGTTIGDHWIEMTPEDLYKFEEAAYRNLLNLPKKSELNK